MGPSWVLITCNICPPVIDTLLVQRIASAPRSSIESEPSFRTRTKSFEGVEKWRNEPPHACRSLIIRACAGSVLRTHRPNTSPRRHVPRLPPPAPVPTYVPGASKGGLLSSAAWTRPPVGSRRGILSTSRAWDGTSGRAPRGGLFPLHLRLPRRHPRYRRRVCRSSSGLVAAHPADRSRMAPSPCS